MAEWIFGGNLPEFNAFSEKWVNHSRFCYEPGHINSKGVWSQIHDKDYSILDFTIPSIAMLLGIIFLVSQCLQFLLKPFGLPTFVSQILAGMFLGSSGIGHPNMMGETLYPLNSRDSFTTFGMIGFILFEFLMGVKLDETILKISGKKAIAIGVLVHIVPLILAASSSIALRYYQDTDPILGRMFLFAATLQSINAFPVIASLLDELKMLNSEFGRLALSSAMVSDLTDFIMTSVLPNLRVGQGHTYRSLTALACCIVYVILVAFVSRPAMIWIMRRTPEGKPVREIYIVAILVTVMITGFISVAFGQHLIFGPFIFGLSVPSGPPLGSALTERLDSLVSGLLLPVFFAISGMQANLFAINLGIEHLLSLSFMMFLANLGKLIAAMLPCLYCKMPFRDSLSIGIVMCSKGIVDLVTFYVWRDDKTIDDKIFTILVISVVVAAGIVSALLKSLYNPTKKYAGYKKRTILHNKPDAALRVLACINEEENVPPTIKFLEISNPTTVSPLIVFVLHLVEISGRASPLIVSHQLREQTSTGYSKSDLIVNTFRYYEQRSNGVVSMQAFTAISPWVTMHDDVCTVALDKGASLIIIPFHRQFLTDGTMDSGKNTVRTMNQKVLDLAPCSVAILIDRWNIGGYVSATPMQSTSRVAMLFIGGPDDREALSFAKRVSNNASVKLSVVRLMASREDDAGDEETIFDDVVVKDFRISTADNDRVVYTEEELIDGEKTAAIVREMGNENDLVVVGRGHSTESPALSGLAEWNEYPELGVIGDILASSDIQNSVSVMVVKQQTAWVE